jgi:hypothetical protein
MSRRSVGLGRAELVILEDVANSLRRALVELVWPYRCAGLKQADCGIVLNHWQRFGCGLPLSGGWLAASALATVSRCRAAACRWGCLGVQ